MTDPVSPEIPENELSTPDVASKDAPTAGAENGQAVPATAAPEGIRRTKQLREKLLTKLPQLAHASWTIKDDFRIDEEWSSIVNLRADALLGPLESIAPEGFR
jgi:hypothetical protein